MRTRYASVYNLQGEDPDTICDVGVGFAVCLQGISGSMPC